MSTKTEVEHDIEEITDTGSTRTYPSEIAMAMSTRRVELIQMYIRSIQGGDRKFDREDVVALCYVIKALMTEVDKANETANRNALIIEAYEHFMTSIKEGNRELTVTLRELNE